jgi:hypothetical protein
MVPVVAAGLVALAGPLALAVAGADAGVLVVLLLLEQAARAHAPAAAARTIRSVVTLLPYADVAVPASAGRRHGDDAR